jgi:hypothetical protein
VPAPVIPGAGAPFGPFPPPSTSVGAVASGVVDVEDEDELVVVVEELPLAFPADVDAVLLAELPDPVEAELDAEAVIDAVRVITVLPVIVVSTRPSREVVVKRDVVRL